MLETGPERGRFSTFPLAGTEFFVILICLAQKLRLQYAGAIDHVMNRGDHREAIFLDDQDRQAFLQTLAEAGHKTEWQIHASCLMGNHFHLVVETPQPNLVAGMKWLLQTYTRRFNHRHRLFGHLFSGRYKALLVEGSGNGYLRTVGEYVHLNPVRGTLIRAEEPLHTYRGSSYPFYLKVERPSWLRVDRVLGEFGIPGDTVAGREQFAQLREQRRAEATAEEYKSIRRGWCLGSPAFREEWWAQVTPPLGPHHLGKERYASAEAKAVRIIAEELTKRGWGHDQRQKRPGCGEAKLGVARRLRQETTMSLNWIAQELGMGRWKYLSKLLAEPRTDLEQLGLGL